MWDCLSDRDRILSECKYQISASDKLGGGLPSKERANMLMDYLEDWWNYILSARQFTTLTPGS